jgi:excisionase family DNA binding protein
VTREDVRSDEPTGDVAGAGAVATPPDAGLLNLKQVARALDVHYMTAYRYVRQGRLPAVRSGNVWLVDPDDVAALASAGRGGAGSAPATAPAVDWAARFGERLLAGDEVGAWTVVSRALASGHTPQRCYLELISGSMAAIGEDVAAGRLSVADQYVATATAQRVGARLGARFRRRGRSRGTVVLGAPAGERHALPIAVVADLARLAGFTVVELGADVPPEAFGLAAERAERLVAVGIGVTTVDHLDAARAAVDAVERAAPGTPVVMGGQAVRNPEVAGLLGVHEWAADGAALVTALDRLAADRASPTGR